MKVQLMRPSIYFSVASILLFMLLTAFPTSHECFSFNNLFSDSKSKSRSADIGEPVSGNILQSRATSDRASPPSMISRHNKVYKSDASANRRRLQFEGMVDNNAQIIRNRKKKPGVGGAGKYSRPARSQALVKLIEEISLGADRYHFWWTGPPERTAEVYKHAEWSSQHNSSNNAVFTFAIKQGHKDKVACSSPNDFRLFLGSLRKSYSGDIVLAVETNNLTPDVVEILKQYKAVVYEISKDLCYNWFLNDIVSIFCGSEEERVPASVFRYYFYEKWSLTYSDRSLIMLVDFRDIVFQSNPFTFHLDDWYPDNQLALFQESYPNMVIYKCAFNKKIMSECYGEDSLKQFGRHVIISSGGIIGSRDAIVVWSRSMTTQLQEAPGRVMDDRCISGGIEHSFINYLVHGLKLRSLMKMKVFLQGDGPLNSLGGLKPDTVIANISGDLRTFWKVLDDDGYILNWSGEVSPVVHQLDHYLDELEALAEVYQKKTQQTFTSKVDFAWQGLSSSRCLWGCS